MNLQLYVLPAYFYEIIQKKKSLSGVPNFDGKQNVAVNFNQ